MVVLETDRLLLRPLELADLDALAEIQADPLVMRFYPDGPRDRARTRDDIEGFDEIRRRHGFSPWGVFARGDGRLIGRSGLLPFAIDGEPVVELNYLLARSCWGRGLATEAARAVRDLGFGRFRLPRLVAAVAPGNARSARVAEKLGMHFDGAIRVEGRPYRVFAIDRPGARPS